MSHVFVPCLHIAVVLICRACPKCGLLQPANIAANTIVIRGIMYLQDWEALYRLCGIKSFMAVPIGGAGEVLGLLTIAKHEEKAFNDEW